MAAEYERVAAEALRKNAYDSSAWNNWGVGLLNEAIKLPTDAALPMLRDAEKKFAVAADLKPSVALHWRNWGVTLYQQATRSSGPEASYLYELACSKYEVYLKHQPRDAAFWHDLAYAHFQRAKLAEGSRAQQLYEAAHIRFAVATDLAPAKAIYWRHWGVTAIAHAETLERKAARPLIYDAAEKFGRASRLAPDDHDYWNTWGSALLDLGKGNEQTSVHWLRLALEKFDEAISRGPHVGAYRYNKAIVLSFLEKLARRTDSYRLLTTIESEYAAALELTLPPHIQVPALLSRAHVLAELGNLTDGDMALAFFNKAETCFEQIRFIDPENKNLPVTRGCLLMWRAALVHENEARRLRSAAKETFHQASEHSSDRSLILSNLASVCITQANFSTREEAERLLAEAEQNCIEAAKLDSTLRSLWDNWASVAHERAKRRPLGDERDRLLADALSKYAEAERLKPGSTAYSRACISALTGDSTNCRALLEAAFAGGLLPRPREIDEETDFDSVRGEDWFVDLMQRYRDERHARTISLDNSVNNTVA